MAIKVQFEIGHSSELKLKKTSEGFTHDWELYVQGVDKADINQFVERVVFNLHNSFRKPKRSYKQPPYALKESGYAGFSLTIDIFFRNREEPRSVTFNYDLDLQQSGPPVHRKEIKRYVFENPSEDFRQRLLKGGGIPVIAGGSSVGDDKNRADEVNRSQLLSKPKLSSDYSKKHKSRSDDKTNTFANLFGPPITKTTQKVSPDPKNKSSPALINNVPLGLTQPSRDKGKDKAVISAQTFGSKDKEKADKKDRHKYNSPHKEKPDSRDEFKKSTDDKHVHDKHDKREEKKKDRILSKERDRSRDHLSKRPLSPKRSSPARSSSAASREDPNVKVSKQNPQSLQSDTIGLTTSSSKKSKKEKKSHEKEKDRDRKEKDRSDSKHREERSNSHSNPAITASSVNEKQSNVKNLIRPNDSRNSDGNKKGKDSPLFGVKDVLKDSKKSNDFKHLNERLAGIEKKTSDKDEKRHKHKKKDKNKDKDPKDLLKEKKTKDKLKYDDSKNMLESPSRKLVKNSTAQSPISIAPTQQKQTTLTVPTTSSQLEGSDLDSFDSDSGSHNTNPKSVPKPLPQSDSSSCSFPDTLPTSKSSSSSTALSSSSTRSQPTPQQLCQQFPTDDTNIQKPIEKKDKKLHKTHEKPLGKADSKKRRKNSPTINTFIEPPIKQPKKDLPIKNGGRDKSQSPQLPAGTTIIREDEMTFRQPAMSMSLLNNCIPSYERSPINAIQNPPSGEYFSELQDLHHKIMTLQDNNELQQIVEIIAVTGKYEITKKTFDFDLCKLDRNTVQRLQEFFAMSVS